MVGPLPPSLPYDRTFYKKHVDAHGIPVIGSDKVPDAALLLARDIVIYMLAGRPDLRKEMIARGYRVGVMAQTEMTTDIPEQRDRKKPSRDDPRLTRGERENYDKPGGIGNIRRQAVLGRERARGLGGVYTTGAEENILGYPNTRYYGEHILVHEWSHGIMSADSNRRPAAVRRYPGRVQGRHRPRQIQGPLRGNQRQRILGRGHAVVVLVELRMERRRHASAEPRRSAGLRPEAVRAAWSRLHRSSHPCRHLSCEEHPSAPGALTHDWFCWWRFR